MKVVSCVRGGLLSIVGLYGRISGGLRGGGLPCGGCQRFESAYLQLVNLADTKLYEYDSTPIFRRRLRPNSQPARQAFYDRI